jgi:hypothetical protein
MLSSAKAGGQGLLIRCTTSHTSRLASGRASWGAWGSFDLPNSGREIMKRSRDRRREIMTSKQTPAQQMYHEERWAATGLGHLQGRASFMTMNAPKKKSLTTKPNVRKSVEVCEFHQERWVASGLGEFQGRASYVTVANPAPKGFVTIAKPQPPCKYHAERWASSGLGRFQGIASYSGFFGHRGTE